MMEGLSGISPGTWGQGESRGWALIKKPDAAGSRRELLPAWRASTVPRKYVNPRNPPEGQQNEFQGRYLTR